MKKQGILIDLFDNSGHVACPYIRNNWIVLQVDIKKGIDILEWDYKSAIFDAIGLIKFQNKNAEIVFGLLAAIPCTHYALSGALHFAEKDADGRTDEMQLLCDKTKEIIDWVDSKFNLKFWKVENPMSRIHKLNNWLGQVKFKFNPCDFAGYMIVEESTECQRLLSLGSQKMTKVDKLDLQLVIDYGLYNKKTWLWGKFQNPNRRYIPPVWKDSPMHVLYGGKSERTKELRSIDPKGFSEAFYQANNIEQ